MRFTNPNGTSYRFRMEDVVLMEIVTTDLANVWLRGCPVAVSIYGEQIQGALEALDRL